MNAALAWERRMSETRGEYHTGSDDSAAQPENVRTLPARGGFMQVENVYYDRLIGVLSPTAYYVLSYLLRRTHGYHQESVRLTLDELQAATALSRHTVLKALADLDAAHIVASDAHARTRTQVRTYTILPVEGWCLASLQTSAKNALVENTPSADPQLVQKMHQTRAKSALVGPKTSAKNALLLNTREYKDKTKDKTAATSAATPAPVPPTPSQPTASSEPSKPRAVNPHWDALVSVMGYTPATKTERSNWGKIVKELKEAGADAADIPLRAAHYVSRYGRERLTVNALLNHWSECAAAPPTKAPPAYAARAAPNEPKPLPVRRELARDAKPAPLD